MEALFILLIFSLLLGLGFLAAFFWAQKSGQFEDSETPALRMLFEDRPLKKADSNVPVIINKTDLPRRS